MSVQYGNKNPLSQTIFSYALCLNYYSFLEQLWEKLISNQVLVETRTISNWIQSPD